MTHGQVSGSGHLPTDGHPTQATLQPTQKAPSIGQAQKCQHVFYSAILFGMADETADTVEKRHEA